jgi:pimeloyl-ACP methyl ester carboxylesterase
MFSRFLGQAPEDLEIVVPCRPGYGGPMWGKGVRRPVPSFDDQVAAFRPFLDSAGDKRTIVLGVSYGGALALKTALENPARVAGAVTVAMLVTEPRKYVHGAIRFAEVWGVRHALPGYLHNARAEIAARRTQVEPLFARLPELRAPVTIMHGDLDTLVPLSDAKTLQRYFGDKADIEFELVKGGTHYLELQYPQRLYATIRRLIERIERSGV